MGPYFLGDKTPVDMYPQGVSPYGLFDMCGNIPEWTWMDFVEYGNGLNTGRESSWQTSPNNTYITRCVYWAPWSRFGNFDIKKQEAWDIYSGSPFGFRLVAT